MTEKIAELSTKERIVLAALETIKEEGFAGTSARAIARHGSFNQALIFYHFGTLSDLMLAALDRTSDDRMRRYREQLAKVQTLEGKIRVATELYREDLASGHVVVVSELVAGSLSRPDLAPEVVKRMEPWVELVEGVLRDAIAGTMFEQLVQPRAAAFLVVAMYLGVDLLAHLDPGNVPTEALFEIGGRLAQLLLPAMGGES